MDKTEREYVIYGGAGLLALVVVMTMMRGNSAPSGTVAAPSSSQLNFLLKNTEDANAQALAQSQLAANSLLSYQTAKNNFELGLQQIQAEVSINSTNAQSAKDIATIQADAQSKVAQLAQQTTEYVAGQQAQAAHDAAYYQAYSAYANSNAQIQSSRAQANAGIWESIISGIANIGTKALAVFG